MKTSMLRRAGALRAGGSIFVAIGLTLATAFAAPESDTEVAARKAALDLAGAFSNEGFKMRDGHWSGTIKPKDHALIAVNLYSGNQYWFSVGATDPATIGAEQAYLAHDLPAGALRLKAEATGIERVFVNGVEVWVDRGAGPRRDSRSAAPANCRRSARAAVPARPRRS